VWQSGKGAAAKGKPTAGGKKVVAKKGAVKAAPKANPLFPATPRNFRVGGALRVS
jgi:hypothetical protein